MNNRRDFLKTTFAGLFLGLVLPEQNELDAQGRGRGAGAPKPNAYIHIAPDDSVTFLITKAEMGQGTVTSLSQLLADELDCDWAKVRTEFAPVDPALYGMQGVFGSQSIRSLWMPLRQAGATARALAQPGRRAQKAEHGDAGFERRARERTRARQQPALPEAMNQF